MKKKIQIVFLTLSLLLCAIPFLGMLVRPTESSNENRELAAMPKIQTKSGKLNAKYFKELNQYYNDHFAFRNHFVMADALIQSEIFKTSNVESLVVGKEDWLYYSSSMDDYLGQNVISERSAYNIAKNISIMQEFVQDKGVKFLFTVPPNKVSLYPQYLPYYNTKKISDINNRKLICKYLAELKVNYLDLFDLFEKEDEILYEKRDSHWSNKGAVLAYHALLEALEQEHDNYELVKGIRKKDYYGDLDKMLYPIAYKPEYNETYAKEHTYQYVAEKPEEVSVEDGYIVTKNPSGENRLLMYRDSFGNTLLPLMSDSFKKATYEKRWPYMLEEQLKVSKADAVISERVERKIKDYIENPPVFSAPSISLDEKEIKEELGRSDLTMESCDYSSEYWQFSGNIDKKQLTTKSNVILSITQGKKRNFYESFAGFDQEYRMYLSKDIIKADKITVDLLLQKEDSLTKIFTKEIDVNQININEME